MYDAAGNVTWAGYPGTTTTNTVTYTPHEEWQSDGVSILKALVRQFQDVAAPTDAKDFNAWEPPEERARPRDRCCDYCGCLLPGEYRPTCSQCGGPVRARQAGPRSEIGTKEFREYRRRLQPSKGV